LPSTLQQGDGVVDNGGYGKYRIFVDFIGHKDLGGKVVLYLFDALWSSTDYNGPPWKWRLAPFDNHYPASVFASQDPVAIESVGFDFLRAEFYNGNPSGKAFPQYSGVDDFLHQAADSTNWPICIKYDPEQDGTYLPRSMGVHEHWNNATNKQYTRNLDPTNGTGIELEKIEQTSTEKTEYFAFYHDLDHILPFPHPPPPSRITTISYHLFRGATDMDLSIYNVQGQRIKTLVHERYMDTRPHHVQWDGKVNGITAASGVYFVRLSLRQYQIVDISITTSFWAPIYGPE
jgi:hypothetical protein